MTGVTFHSSVPAPGQQVTSPYAPAPGTLGSYKPPGVAGSQAESMRGTYERGNRTGVPMSVALCEPLLTRAWHLLASLGSSHTITDACERASTGVAHSQAEPAPYNHRMARGPA